MKIMTMCRSEEDCKMVTLGSGNTMERRLNRERSPSTLIRLIPAEQVGDPEGRGPRLFFYIYKKSAAQNRGVFKNIT